MHLENHMSKKAAAGSIAAVRVRCLPKIKNMEVSMKNTPFQKISDACAATGLSAYYLRLGCRDGSVPCIKSGRSGKTYYVNVPALLEKLNAAQRNVEGK